MSMMNPVNQAKKHPIFHEGPAVDFFEGALLGNGGLGLVVTTRPDAVELHVGHNNVWDIRIAEHNKDRIGTFNDVFNVVNAISDEEQSIFSNDWFKQYCAMAGENYSKQYPAPMPCGTLILGFDRREAELLDHCVDISTGICEIRFLIGSSIQKLQIFVESTRDKVWLQMIDEAGNLISSPFKRIKMMADPVRTQDLPEPKLWQNDQSGALYYSQLLPHREQWRDNLVQPKDKAFCLSASCNSTLYGHTTDNIYAGVKTGLDEDPISQAMSKESYIEYNIGSHEEFICCLELVEGFAESILDREQDITLSVEHLNRGLCDTKSALSDYWSRSGVALDDPFLEQLWYHNLYFFYCAVRPGVTCPGLYANWSFKEISSVWHGDYHFNYNIQQPFWVAFSSNHTERHLPYVDLIDHVLPISKQWAEEYYGLKGAAFPHSAYPVEMNMMPYPVPTWGWEVCETPWAVQSLWWHYLYTLDEQFLRNRAFTPMKEAVTFLVDYMKRPDASGAKWGDDKVHIFPTVSPELYGIVPGLSKNYDCIVDLTLTKFIFQAFLKACKVLDYEKAEDSLMKEIQGILIRFPDYPTGYSEKLGEVFVSVPGEDPELVYNTPNSLMTVFPGEDHGLHSDEETYQKLVRTYRNHRNEGGNDLVFYHLQGARLGILDLEKFKRQVKYCLLPNGTCTDKVMQVGGRYSDTLAFDFMGRMGVWFENFSLPAVINECLLQSYNGILRFFPNWQQGGKAEFKTLRAAGGFLVSALKDGPDVICIEISSESGSMLRFYNPWNCKVQVNSAKGVEIIEGTLIELKTDVGETIKVVPLK